MLTVAAAQIDIAFGNKDTNVATILARLREAAGRGAKLVVFPECAITGYAFESRAAALKVAEPIPGPSTSAIAAECAALGVWAIVGTLEKVGDKLFNSAALIGPKGIASVYRKLHLPCLGVDQVADAGDRALEPVQTPFGRIGMTICYDGSFPETARVLKLRGAQLIALPTNWPEQAQVSIDHQSIVRAFENHVNYIAVNRVGSEGGFKFPGGSKIVDYSGKVLAIAGETPVLLFAELDLPAADLNRVINIPGKYELDRIANRRPDFYGPITSK